jgi:rhodanese-related sulfurtransferase
MIRQIYKLLTAITFIIFISNCNSGQDAAEINMKDFKDLMAKDSSITILDVRTEPELNGPLGHIDGIINIPVQNLENRISEMNSFKNKKIYVICRSGNRSRTATQILNSHGFKSINVLGGMTQYRNSD